MLHSIKKKVLSAFWPYGKVAKILRGPLKSYCFIVSENSGWSPIVGRWEPEAHALFIRVVNPGDVVYDLGANNGIHSLLFSKLVGTAGKVFAFEPLEKNCKEITTNYEVNNIRNLEVVNVAVGEKKGSMNFFLGLHDKQGSLVGIGRESGKKIDVPIITIDDFITEGNAPPDFIKIDIEGAESLALNGFAHLIDSIRPLLFIELHTPEQDTLVGRFLQEHSYEAYRLEGNVVDPALTIPGLKKINDLTQPFPAVEGIWGTILAIHPSRISRLKKTLQQ